MAKKRTRRRKAATPPQQTHDEQVTGMLGAVSNELTKEFGAGRILTQSETDARKIGLPLPSLALRYLLQQDVFPLGRMTLLNGLQESLKTTLLYEIMRWHILYGGYGMLLENESKDSQDVRSGLFDHDPSILEQRMHIIQTRTVDEWQTAITSGLKSTQKYCERKDGPGRSVPVCFGLDSISGKGTSQDHKRIEEKGHGSPAYSTVANWTTQYMQYMPTKLMDWPFSVVGIQHLKKSADPRTGATIRNTPGAKALKFQETIELELTRGRDIETLDQGGVHVRIKCMKNSAGVGRKEISAIVRWWWEEGEDGIRRQKFIWDWYDASIECLLSFAKQKKTLYSALMDVVDLHPNKTQRRVWSRALGIPENDPLTFNEAGYLLEKHHQSLLEEIYKILGIHRRKPFLPGVDYRDLIKQDIPPYTTTLYGENRNQSSDVAEQLGEFEAAAPPEEDGE